MEVGAGVHSVKEGDRVAMEPGLPCWSNRMSRSAFLHSSFFLAEHVTTTVTALSACIKSLGILFICAGNATAAMAATEQIYLFLRQCTTKNWLC